jgi:hypothetical protein
MKKYPAHDDFDDFGIRVDYAFSDTLQLSRPSSGTKIGFQMNATPISSFNENSRAPVAGIAKLNFQDQKLKLPTSQMVRGLRRDADNVSCDSKAIILARNQRSSEAITDGSRSNSRPSTANNRDIGGGETRRSSMFGGGSETRRSSEFGGADTRRSSTFSAASYCSERNTPGILKDFGKIDSLNHEITLTNGNFSGLIQVLTNFLWLAAGEKRFCSRSVALVWPEAFTNASLFHDEFEALAAFCCSELKESSTLYSYIAELIALATWQKFKTRISMFFLFGSVQGPLSPDQRGVTKQFNAKLQELAFSLCGNLENIQFQVQLCYDVIVDSVNLEEHLLSLLEKSNNGIAESPPPEFSIAVDQFVRNQAQAHITPQFDGIKINIESNQIFQSSRLSASHKSKSFSQKFGKLKMGPQDLQEQVEHLLNDRSSYWLQSPQMPVMAGGGDFFVKDIIRSAEKESLRSKNTLEALKAAQQKICFLEKRLVKSQDQDHKGFSGTASVKSTATKLSTPKSNRGKLSSVQSWHLNANSADELINELQPLNSVVLSEEQTKIKSFVNLETNKYQLTSGIESIRIVIIADSMKGTTFEYSGQFGTGAGGQLLTRDGSGRCEWKSPGGFLCWYVGDWRDDRPHGWGRSGRGALVESGVFEDGRLSLKGWPEIMDSESETFLDEPRWPAQRGRSEATIPDPEPLKLPSARVSPPEPPVMKRPPWYLRLSSAKPEVKEEKVLPLKSSKSAKISVEVEKVVILSYKPFCCFWSEGSCEKCPSDGDSMSLSEAYRMGCIASHLAQENAATTLEKDQQKSLFVLVCFSGNERCNIVLFGNKLEGLPQEYAGAVSPQTRMRNGFGISIWHSDVYGSCWCISPITVQPSVRSSSSRRYGGMWTDGACNAACRVFFLTITQYRSSLRLGAGRFWHRQRERLYLGARFCHERVWLVRKGCG